MDAFGTVHPSPGDRADSVRTVPAAPTERRATFDPAEYAMSLQTSREVLEGLGLLPETARAWKCGITTKGVIHKSGGRLALPVCDLDGTVKAYISRALDGPQLLWHNGFDASAWVFGADRLEGEFRIVRDPLDVILIDQATGEKAVCFLTETISGEQVERLAAIMDAKKAELVF